ncbi:HAD family hydrolase [Roseburia hominis]
MRKRAALFFDIDGTVLSDHTKQIPESTKCALKEAKECGHLLFVNTGRTTCRLPHEILEQPFDGFLCGCGIYLTFHEQVFFEMHLTEEDRKEIVAFVRKCRIDGVFEGTDDVYFFSGNSRFEQMETMKAQMALVGLGVTSYVDQVVCPYDKMFLVMDEQSDKDRFLREISRKMQVIDRGCGTYECVPAGYSKATAIEAVLKKFGLDKEQAYVFGDSSNDLPMFQYAVHTVAMGEHSPVLEPYTEFITKTVEEDGIEYALRHYSIVP